ncbi:MAG: 5-formyltetrahydrofolate cyclo-ligase [Rikenellaceae bacterium]
MGKLLIRQHIRQQQANLTAERREAASKCIFAAIESANEFIESNYIAIYHALADEIPTMEVIERWSEMGKTVLLPRVEGEQMQFYRANNTELKAGSYGILEPQVGEPVDAKQIELMVVPGVAFCRDGRRLGRGKGYYDRYLSKCANSLYKIGVCFNHQIVENIPCDIHDISMNVVLSD